ncbi:MAG: ester cyclase [Verrucomicrobiota bacterium]
MEVLSEAPELKQITMEWFERLWNQLDLTVVDQWMREDCEVLGLGNTVVGRSGLKQVHESFTSAFDQIHVEVVELVVDGAEVAGHARFAARHRQSEREVDFMFSLYGVFEDGGFRRVRNVVDYTSLMSQLNLLEPQRMQMMFEAPVS